MHTQLVKQSNIKIFNKNVVKSEGCWGWLGSVTSQGFPIVDNRSARALSWRMTHGEYPDALHLKSTCGTKLCCNPAHLKLVYKEIKLPTPVNSRSLVVCKKMKARFWKKVDKKSDQECWNWTGVQTGRGYGYMLKPRGSGEKRVQFPAHRVSYSIHFGDVLAGKVVCHKCDNPLCVNPNHLFLGESKDNCHDMMRKGRDKLGSLNQSQVDEIRATVAENPKISKPMLAQKYGVTRYTIYHIIAGKTWNLRRDVVRDPLGDKCPTNARFRLAHQSTNS